MESPQDKLVRLENEITVPAHHRCLTPDVYSHTVVHEDDSQVSLVDYWAILVKRRWIVLGALLMVLGLTAFITWRQTPIYRAALKLQIDVDRPNILPFKDYASPDFGYIPTEEYLKTQFEALSSRTLATRVIRALKLEADPRFLGTPRTDITDWGMQWARRAYHWWHPAKTPPAESPVTVDKGEDQRLSPLAAAFVASVTVTPVKDSRVVVVSFDSQSPELAAEALNTLASEYIQMNFETKYNATITASDFLAKQLVDLKAHVKRSEAELVKFGRQHNIYALGEKENVIMQKLGDLNTAWTQAQAERIQKESIWQVVRQAGNGQFPDGLRNEDIRKLEANVGQLQQQLARLRALYKQDWPEVKQVASQLAVAQKQLVDAQATAIKEVDAAYRSAVQREKLLFDAVEAQKNQANRLNQDSIQYSILKREVDSSKQIYDGMLQRMKEAGISAGLNSNNIHVVDPAESPKIPYLPDKTANILKALAGGLLLGLALAFFLEHVSIHSDKSIKTPDDIDRYIRLPFLGLIPSAETNSAASRRGLLPATARYLTFAGGANGSNRLIQEPMVELITHVDNKSLVSEAYRDLRTSVLLSASADRSPKAILVTSSLKGEGKTTTSINLGITLAQADERVLLVDCDMRNPNIHRIFGLANMNGLSSVLSETSADSFPLIQATQIPNLFVFTAGLVPPNPSELIGSARMKNCVTALSERFDHILIDSPPLLAVTDARILATMVDGVVLVIKGGKTTKEAVIRSRRLLRDVHARILGTLLNNIDFRSSGSYYYSKYYYDVGGHRSRHHKTNEESHAVP